METFTKWQEESPYVHFCWKCKTIAPVIPCSELRCHLGCKGNLGTLHEITKEQFANMSETDKQELVKLIDIKYQDFLASRAEYLSKEHAKSLASRPHCPMCKSTDFSKISTGSRMASIFAFGLASSSIGKQYKCNKCGHKW